MKINEITKKDIGYTSNAIFDEENNSMCQFFIYFYPDKNIFIKNYSEQIIDNNNIKTSYTFLDGINDGLIEYIPYDDEKAKLFSDIDFKEIKPSEWHDFFIDNWNNYNNYILYAQKNREEEKGKQKTTPKEIVDLITGEKSSE